MESPIRVAQVMGKMLGGGVETVVMNYYRHIDHGRVQFDLIVDSDSTIVPVDEIESFGGRVIEVPPYQQQPANSNELERLFRREGWRIVHSHMNSLSVFSLRAAKRAGVPVRIAHSHSTWGKGELGKNALKAILRTQANRFPTHRLACTNHAGKWLFGENTKFDILQNAIELERFSFNEQVRHAVREELGILDSSFVVGSVGRLTPQKNQFFLVDEFSRIEDSRNAILLLIGEGPDREGLEQEIQGLGISDRVFLLGQCNDINRLYSAMDVFCLPSKYEGLGIVAIEAQANGLQTIVSNKVPSEAVLSNTVQVLPLTRGLWTHELDILRCAMFDIAAREMPQTSLLSYDIELEAPKLASFYERILREGGDEVSTGLL